MTILPFGDSALLINFEQVVSSVINRMAVDLTGAIRLREIDGITFCAPAYCSVTVGYDPSLTSFQVLKERIEQIAEAYKTPSGTPGRKLKIPVCYDPSLAPDLADVSEYCGLSMSRIIDIHCSQVYRVFMLGFLPGFVYLGKVPEQLYTPRKARPRWQVPAQSVGLAGHQTGIYPSPAPGGWQIIGRTPVPTFYPGQPEPFLLHPGDMVRFYPVSLAEFAHLQQAERDGDLQDLDDA